MVETPQRGDLIEKMKSHASEFAGEDGALTDEPTVHVRDDDGGDWYLNKLAAPFEGQAEVEAEKTKEVLDGGFLP
jgi:hypothetical protein